MTERELDLENLQQLQKKAILDMIQKNTCAWLLLESAALRKATAAKATRLGIKEETQ